MSQPSKKINPFNLSQEERKAWEEKIEEDMQKEMEKCWHPKKSVEEEGAQEQEETPQNDLVQLLEMSLQVSATYQEKREREREQKENEKINQELKELKEKEEQLMETLCSLQPLLPDGQLKKMLPTTTLLQFNAQKSQGSCETTTGESISAEDDNNPSAQKQQRLS